MFVDKKCHWTDWVIAVTSFNKMCEIKSLAEHLSNICHWFVEFETWTQFFKNLWHNWLRWVIANLSYVEYKIKDWILTEQNTKCSEKQSNTIVNFSHVCWDERATETIELLLWPLLTKCVKKFSRRTHSIPVQFLSQLCCICSLEPILQNILAKYNPTFSN